MAIDKFKDWMTILRGEFQIDYEKVNRKTKKFDKFSKR